MQESPSNGGFDARTNSSISTASTSSQPLLVAVGTAAPLPDHDPFSQHRQNIQSTVDDPLFELMIPDVEVINDTGPRSAPAAEDFPIGSFARLASVLVCRDILGEAMPDWWHHLILEGVDLRIERHCDEYALVAGSVSTQAWGLEPRDETDVVAFQVMVHRACMLAPRISHGNGSRYQTPTAIAASLRLVPSSGAVATSSVMPNLSATLTPSDVDLKLAVEQGNAKLKEGNCAQAIEYYTMAIQLAEGNVAHTGSKLHIRALSNRSAAFFKLWDFDRALQDGERCAVLDRKSIVGYIRAGTASRGKKQFDLADNWFRKALQIDTQSQDRIQAYIEANAIAQALHDSVSRVAKFIDVSVDPSRISVIAKKKFENKERIFTELPWAAVSLEPPNAACPTCNHCHMQLWDRDMVGRALHAACLDLSDSAKTQAAQMLLGFTGCQKQTECRHKCGAHYCGKRCADLAYDEYHWAECSAHGKWKTCMNFIDRLMTADSTFAKVLHPYAIRLAIRVLAIFFVKKGDRSGGDATAFLQRMLTRRTGILFNELPPNQVEIVNRVRDALVPHLTADQVRVVVDDGALLSITEHVMHCDTKFNVSILHRAQEAVDIHRGWLHDGPPADASTFAVLAELDAAYRAAIEQNQIRCSGLFRLVCCIQMAGEPHVYSFSELDTTSLGASLLRAASPSPGDHDGSGSSNSGRPGNCHLVVQTASAMHGITVQASTAVSRHQCLVLSDPNAMSGTRNSKRTSTSSVGRIRKSSSPLDGSRLAAVAVPQ